MYSTLITQNEVTQFKESLFDRFAAFTDVSAKTLYGYMNGLNSFKNWLSDNGIDQPKREDVKAYKAFLAEKGYAVTTQGNYLRTIKHFFRWLSSEGLYPNVADNIKGVKVSQDNTRKDAFDKADLNAVLSAIDTSSLIGARDFAIIQLCAVCALRIIEVCRADIEDLQMKRGEHILYIMGKGHAEKDAYVKLPEDLYKSIEAYLAMRKDTGKNRPLFTAAGNRARINPDGTRDERLSEPSLSTIIKNRFRAAGYDMKKLSAHSLRHSGVTTLLLANGGNIQQAQHYARHKNISTTCIYAHNIEREKDHSEEEVFNYLFGDDKTPKDLRADAIDLINSLPADKVEKVINYIATLTETDSQKSA